MNVKSRNRRLAIGVALAVGSVALAACGSSGTTSAGGGASTNASASAVPSTSANPALVAKVPAAIKSSGKLIVGTDASYAPAEFYAEDGKTIIGYDVDLGNAIAAKLGLKGDFQNAKFDSLIVGVEKNKYNASMSSFTITAVREKQVNMVSHFSAGTSWAVAQGNPMNITPDTACGMTIAVQKATTQSDEDLPPRQATCTAKAQPMAIQQYDLQTDVATAVASGKADAMLADSPVTAYAIKQTNGKLQQTGDIYGTALQGVLVAKDQTPLAQVVQSAVQELINEGTYQKILDAWGVGFGAISQSQLNPTP